MSKSEIYKQAFDYANSRVDADEARAYADDCVERFNDGGSAVSYAKDFMRWNSENSWADPEMTGADHAKAWARENGETIPDPGTPEWDALYERWNEFAFSEDWNKN